MNKHIKTIIYSIVLFLCFSFNEKEIKAATPTPSPRATATIKTTQSPTPTAKATSTPTPTVTPTASPKTASGSAVSDFENAKKEIIKGYQEYKTSVDVSEFNLNYETQYKELQSMMSSVVNSTPGLFYTGTEYKVSRNSSTNIIVSIVLGYAPEYAKEDGTPKIKKIKKDVAKLDSSVTIAMTLIKSTMNRVEKALLLHDYLISKIKYKNDDTKHFLSREIGALVKGKANCQGYSLAYALLLEKAGIKNVLVSSESMSHQWNKIKLGKFWYNIDLAYDDPVDSITSTDQFGLVMHNHFLCSDYDFEGKGYKDLDSENYPSNTKYDKKFWRDLTSQVWYHNNTFMYMGVKGIIERPRLLKKSFTVKYNVDGLCMIKYTENLFYFLYNNTIYLYNYNDNVTVPLWKCAGHYPQGYQLTQIKCVKKSILYKVSDTTILKQGRLPVLSDGKLA